jgi:hypothetical protein
MFNETPKLLLVHKNSHDQLADLFAVRNVQNLQGLTLLLSAQPLYLNVTLCAG